jgi:hypothetical protein
MPNFGLIVWQLFSYRVSPNAVMSALGRMEDVLEAYMDDLPVIYSTDDASTINNADECDVEHSFSFVLQMCMRVLINMAEFEVDQLFTERDLQCVLANVSTLVGSWVRYHCSTSQSQSDLGCLRASINGIHSNQHIAKWKQ